MALCRSLFSAAFLTSWKPGMSALPPMPDSGMFAYEPNRMPVAPAFSALSKRVLEPQFTAASFHST